MADFTSSLYLGFQHPAIELAPWSQLTSGRPAALGLPCGSDAVAEELARLVGCGAAVLSPSSLHLFMDLCVWLGRRECYVLVDAGAYPTVQWCLERALLRGVPVRRFAHFDVVDLASKLASSQWLRQKPVVITDGFCPACGRLAPLRSIHKLLVAHGGYLIIDDTQALGVLGAYRRPSCPFGVGGGGSLRWSNLRGQGLMVVGSLAKAFGVPAAFLAASSAVVDGFLRHSGTHVHSSPVSAADVSAAQRALALNARYGNGLRRRLFTLISRFRWAARQLNLDCVGGAFPLQTVIVPPLVDALELRSRYAALGVESFLYRGHSRRHQRIGFLLTASHQIAEIDESLALLATLLADEFQHHNNAISPLLKPRFRSPAFRCGAC